MSAHITYLTSHVDRIFDEIKLIPEQLNDFVGEYCTYTIGGAQVRNYIFIVARQDRRRRCLKRMS